MELRFLLVRINRKATEGETMKCINDVFDIKFYEGNREKETVRGLTYSQALVIKTAMDRLNIKCLVKNLVKESYGLDY